MDRTVAERLLLLAQADSTRGNHTRAELLYESVKQIREYYALLDRPKMFSTPRESNWGSDWVDDGV